MRYSRRMVRPLLIVLLSIGCASHQAPVVWATSYGQDHPLTGRIYSGATGSFVRESQLRAATDAARWLLLGESHDHPDHHRLQARLLRSWLGGGGPRSVGFEMLDEDQAPALDPQPETSSALAQAVRWEASGWPDFELYRPVFDALLLGRARVVAAHPSRARLRAAMMDAESVSDAERTRLALAPLPDAEQQALERQIHRAHCGHGGDAMLRAMAFGQRYKDAFMAAALLDTGAPSALIAGAEHVRRDRGVPIYLERRAERGVITVGFLQVDDERPRVADYEVDAFDFVWFTPRVSDRDPCEEFREQLERMSH